MCLLNPSSILGFQYHKGPRRSVDVALTTGGCHVESEWSIARYKRRNRQKVYVIRYHQLHERSVSGSTEGVCQTNGACHLRMVHVIYERCMSITNGACHLRTVHVNYKWCVSSTNGACHLRTVSRVSPRSDQWLHTGTGTDYRHHETLSRSVLVVPRGSQYNMYHTSLYCWKE